MKKYAGIGAICAVLVVSAQYIAVVLDIHASAELEISWLEEAIYYALGDVEEAIYYALGDVEEAIYCALGDVGEEIATLFLAFVNYVDVFVVNVGGACFLG